MRLVLVFLFLAGLATWAIWSETSRREDNHLSARAQMLRSGVATVLDDFVAHGRILHAIIARDPQILDLLDVAGRGGGTSAEEAGHLSRVVLGPAQEIGNDMGLRGLSLLDAQGKGPLLSGEAAGAPARAEVPSPVLSPAVLRALETLDQVSGFERGPDVFAFHMIRPLRHGGRRLALMGITVSRQAVLQALERGMPGVSFDVVLAPAGLPVSPARISPSQGGAEVLGAGAGVPKRDGRVVASGLGSGFERPIDPRTGALSHDPLRGPEGGLRVDAALAAASAEGRLAGLARGQAFALYSHADNGDPGIVALVPVLDLNGEPLGYICGFWLATEHADLRATAWVLLGGVWGGLGLLCFVAIRLRRVWGRAEAERRQLLTVTDTMGEGLYVVDCANRLLLVNKAACRVLGYGETEMLGLVAHDLFHARSEADPDPGPLVACPIHQAVASRSSLAPLTTCFRRKDGMILTVEVSCNPIQTGDGAHKKNRSWAMRWGDRLLGSGDWCSRKKPVPASVVTFVDVTERRRREAALLKLSRAVEQSSASVLITDAEGIIEYVNPAFCQISGYAPEEVLGRRPSVLKSGRVPTEVYREMWEALTNGREWRGEFHNRRKDGSLYWEQATISPIKSEDGQITHFVAVKDDITAKKEIEEELFHRANYDPLTGLPNRQLLLDRLNTALAVARRENHRVAVMFMDLDRFKQVNDTLGHNAGDVLLKQAASRLSAVLRPQDTLGRLGGDEFLVVAPGLHKPAEATTVASRLLEVSRQPFTVDGRDIYVSASIGVSLGPNDGTTAQVLMRNADSAMYLAKENGRDGYHFFTPEVEAASRRRMAIENGLRVAVRDGGFSLVFQPIFSSRDSRMSKAEALVRWTHPQLGPVSPGEFIDIAEETGQIVGLGAWVLEEACRALASLDLPDDGPFRIGVNMSSKQFSPALSAQVQEILARHGVSPQHLEIEITERLLLHPSADILGQLEALRACGVSIAIDDFGTGYSALSYLTSFRIDTLKIDRSFVTAMVSDARSHALVGAITRMAHTLEARVVAEGVETSEQAVLLSALGVDDLQGFLLGRPMSLESLQSLLYRTGAAAAAV